MSLVSDERMKVRLSLSSVPAQRRLGSRRASDASSSCNEGVAGLRARATVCCRAPCACDRMLQGSVRVRPYVAGLRARATQNLVI